MPPRNVSKTPSKTSVIALATVLILLTITYTDFASFRPKKLAELREVKGTKTRELEVPYPRNSQVVSSSRTVSKRQITLQTVQTPQELQEFYKNVLLEEGWIIETEGKIDAFYTTKYKKEKRNITISTSQQDSAQEKLENTTVLSIDITL